MNVFELFGTIAIDHSEAERGLDKTVRHAKETEGALEKTFKRIGGFVAAAFSVGAVIDFGKTCTQVFASVAAEESAFAQIMGDYADTATAKLNAVADQTGITSTRMTGAMTSMTAKFMGLGYSVEDATTLASDGLLIAADAAAFWDMSMDESMAHLNSFINGSYEGGEAIGLFANDTQMAAYAVEKGIVKTAAEWANLDEATKQATRLDYAKNMQKQSGVTGQAAKEADSYANVMANLQESWRQFQAVIGKPILERFVLPAMKKLNEFMPILTEAVSNGIDWLTEGFDKIAEYFSEVFTENGLNMNAFPDAMRDMFRDVARAIPALLSNVGRSIRNAWVNTVWPAVQGAFKMVFGVDLPKWSAIEKSVLDWWDGGNGIAKEIAKVCNWTLNLFGEPASVTEKEVLDVLDTWWTNTKTFVQNACNWVLKLFENPVEAAEDVEKKVKGWWDGVKSGAMNALVWTLKLFGVPVASADGVKNLVSGWWSGVKQKAQDALNWTLKLFDNPKETAGIVATRISTWWAGVKNSAQSVLNWVLKLFGVPAASPDAVKNLVSGWWSGVKQKAQDALIWVLKLFSNPKEAAADVKNAVSGWWNGVRVGAESALDWVLKLFGVPAAKADGVKNLVSGWWNGVKTAAQEALNWTLKLFSNPKETAGQIATNISLWWAGVVSSAQSALEWWLQLFENPKETAEKVGEVVGDWWSGVKQKAQDALIWTLKLFGVPTASPDGVGNLVSSWWIGVKQKAQDALIWVLQLFGAPENPTQKDITDLLGTWWTNVKGLLSNACQWVLNLFGVPDDPTLEDITSLLGTWWSGVKVLFAKVLTWTLNMFGVPGVPTADGLRNMLGTWWTGVKSGLATVCKWALNMFGLPEGDPVSVITEWWEGIRPSIESALGIDLSGINIAGVFTAAETAINNVIEAAKSFYSNIVNALYLDEEGRIKLNKTLSGLFDAGIIAISDLLGSASTLVIGIVNAITGNEADAKKIGGVFENLFGWASEIIISVKEGAIGAFQWLIDHREQVTGALTGIAVTMIALAAANPATALIASLVSLIAIMSTDWGEFEKKYPKIVDMFEKLTGLSFSGVADSLERFKSTIIEVIDYFASNESAINEMLILLGAVATYTGNPAIGVALMGAGGINVAKDYATKGEEKTRTDLESDGFSLTRLLLPNDVEGKLDSGASYDDLTPEEQEDYDFANKANAVLEFLKFGLSSGSREGTIAYRMRPREPLGTGEILDALDAYNNAVATGRPEVLLNVLTTMHPYDSQGIIDRNTNRNRDDGGSEADQITFDPENYVPGNAGMQSFLTMMQAWTSQIKADVTAAVQEGMSGVTITADVDAGNVVLDGGAIVGALAPKINLVLGALGRRNVRG